MKISKIEAAEINLRHAIRLFFSEASPIPIETLNGAASGILRPLAQKRGLRNLLHDSDLVKDEYRKEWIKILHAHQNFFKHADRDGDEILEYKDETLRFMILESCHLYRHLASIHHLKHRQLIEAIAYEIWFSLKYPHLLIDPKALTKLPGANALEGIDPNDFSVWRTALNIRNEN